MSATALQMQPSFDPELRLLVPDDDVYAPELSIVIPAMNERITIADFVDWCKEGMRKAGVAAEILIVDSSSDETPRIALEHGARVLKTPKRGLGRAYIDAIPYIRGKYVLMGDADCTYDFREFSGFVEQFRAGAEFVMGSRFKGYIEPDSMPPLHRYFGTPFTTWILNFLYSTKFSDIHCGMRGITREALIRIQLESQSWEYASEMVLKSVCLKLRTAEVPVRFLKDREGRLSHMKRSGWMEPWRAGWINLRAMLVYGADFFLLRPGVAMLAVGLVLMLGSALGPLRIGPVTLSLYWSLAGLAIGVVGIQSFCLGCVVRVIYSYTAESRARWLRLFKYTRAMIVAGALAVLGAGLTAPLIVRYVAGGWRLTGAFETESRMAVCGLFLLLASFTVGNATLAVHAAALACRNRYTR
jgi:glycosyltransferase involved in cell wall biosynthesis